MRNWISVFGRENQKSVESMAAVGAKLRRACVLLIKWAQNHTKKTDIFINSFL